MKPTLNNQAYLGYSIIFCKQKIPSLSQLTSQQWQELYELVKILELSYTKAFGATLFNWTCLMNDEYKSQQPKPHVHWHMRPRYKKKVMFANELFEDTEFAHHYNKLREHNVSRLMLELIGKEIKQTINKDL